jgi:hypothetical protein
MYRDLETRILPIGTARERLIEILGKPTRIDDRTQCLLYELGLCSGFKIDTDYLRACFDPAGVLSKLSHFQS